MGDKVRLTYRKSIFTRSYHPKWTGEIFKITKRYLRDGIPVYRVADLVDEDVTGGFYTGELQKVIVNENDYYKIEKILRKRKRKGRTEYLVRWLNFPPKFDQWVDSSQLSPIKGTT